MLNYLRNFVTAIRGEARDPHPQPSPPTPLPVATARPSPLFTSAPWPPAKPDVVSGLSTVQNWSHPFGDPSNPLLHLTQLAKAQAGYYPLGRNGLWHGGVHFDSGTAGTIGKTEHADVRCLADGEVVAYRIPEQTPTSTFFPGPGVTVTAPFATGFVLVRHRLEVPRVEGSKESPPNLVFYSLYMHLQDWAHYQADPDCKRPGFWPERNLRVKADAPNSRPGTSQPRGLSTYNKITPYQRWLDLLPPGTPVEVGTQGQYRKLEGVCGPSVLRNEDGSLRGYVAFEYLKPLGGTAYRVRATELNVRAAPSELSEKLFKLYDETEVTISGEGRFRKLESIAQYLDTQWLEGDRIPEAGKPVVVLERPVPIKAGELIGHVGPYQESTETHPQHKLHLEVFSGEDVEQFFSASRIWAQQLPAQDNTWLKLVQGTPVVAHQEHFNSKQPPTFNTANTPSGAELLVPRRLLDELPANHTIKVDAKDGRNPLTWYRLDGLLNAADGSLLDGWVREEVGVTPWVSPWSWDGYEIIFNYESPEQALAYFFSKTGLLGEEAAERLRPMADQADQGQVRARLFDLIDSDRDGIMTAEELQAALRIPAHAQSIARLVIHYESEWYHRQPKWDVLDQVLGHTSSAPILNWVAEKKRIKQLSWWDEVAAKVGLPERGQVYHFHPVGLMGNFSATNDDNDLRWLKVPYGQLTFDVEGNDVEDETDPLHRYFSRIVHWPGGASGVTIGRGYDLGQRPDPESDLRAAGIPEPLQSWLIGAKGLKGVNAHNYYTDAPLAIKKQAITRKQQYELFIPVYNAMKSTVIRISSKNETADRYGDLNWESISPEIQDVVIDLTYRGDYTPSTRKIIQKPFVDNDYHNVKKEMSNEANWKGVPRDRYRRRKDYL